MSERRRGLGRGLGALIPTGPAPVTERPGDEAPPRHETTESAGATSPGYGEVRGVDVLIPARPGDNDGTGMRPVPGARFAELPVDAITPNARQPRQVFDEETLAELAHSIREVGLLQPVVVRPADAAGFGAAGARYELVMGERRWRAAVAAGLTTIPAIVRTTDDDSMLRDALLENLHRSQLNPLEEAAAYQQLLDDFGCTQDELATRIGRSRPQISNTLRLLRLPPAVARRVAAGVLSAGHARALLALEDPQAQERMAARIVAEGLSVRSVEEIVAVGEGEQARPTRRRTSRPVAPHATELADRLSDRLETRVRVTLGRTKGRIVVEFASIDDLERIVAVMDPSAGRTSSEDSRPAADGDGQGVR